MFYQTRDMVASREMRYAGQALQKGERFRPMSQIDADYLASRGMAKVTTDDTFGPIPALQQPATVVPEEAAPQPPRRRGRPPNASRQLPERDGET